MALKTILNKQTDFTGEFPVEYAKSGLWRFNDVSVDEYGYLADSSGLDRKIELVNYLGTTASLQSGQKGRQIRININNPATEKTYLKVANDGTFFSEMGERILVGGWMIPTTYSVGNTYCPILNTRYGPGQPIFYCLSLQADLESCFITLVVLSYSTKQPHRLFHLSMVVCILFAWS